MIVSENRCRLPMQITDAWLAELTHRKKGKIATLDEEFSIFHQTVVLLIPVVV